MFSQHTYAAYAGYLKIINNVQGYPEILRASLKVETKINKHLHFNFLASYIKPPPFYHEMKVRRQERIPRIQLLLVNEFLDLV